MADDIDLAQQHDEMHRLHALAEHERQRARQVGLPFCADCGEEIAPFRQQLGASLCIDCQRDAEAEDRAKRGLRA